MKKFKSVLIYLIVLSMICGGFFQVNTVNANETVKVSEIGVYPSPPENESIGVKTLGPGGGGAVLLGAVNPQDANSAIVASDMDDAFITHDSGRTWKSLSLTTGAQCLAYDPTNPDTIYIGTYKGCLYRSNDGGDRWKMIYPKDVSEDRYTGDNADYQPVTTDQNWYGGSTYYTRMLAVAVDPANSNHIFTANKILTNNTYRILQSTDGGNNWSQVCDVAGTTTDFVRIFIDPTSSIDNRKIFITSDKGVWTAIVDPTTTSSPVSIMPPVMAANNNTVTSASMGKNPDTGNPVLYLTSNYSTPKNSTLGLIRAYCSIDSGANWTDLNASGGLTPYYYTSAALAFNVVSTCDNNSDVVYISSSSTSYGIFKSIDGGVTWSWVLNTKTKPANKAYSWLGDGKVPRFSYTWGASPYNLSVSPTDPDICYGYDMGGAWNTTDGGATWKDLYSVDNGDGTYTSTGLNVINSYAPAVDPFDPDHIAMPCTDVGLWESYNGGISWHFTAQPANTCYAFVFDPVVQGRAWAVYGSTHDLPRYSYFKGSYTGSTIGGVYVTTNDTNASASWTQCSTGLPGNSGCLTSLVLDPTSDVNNRTLYLTEISNGVYRSTDGGANWTAINSGITKPDSTHIYSWKVVRDSTDGTLYLVNTRVCNATSTSPNTNGASTSGYDGNDENNIKYPGELYKLGPEDESWTKIPLPSSVDDPAGAVFPMSVTVDHPEDNPARIYLSCYPKVISVTGTNKFGGLYYSDNNGINWENILDESLHVYDTTLIPAQAGETYSNKIIAVTFEGYALRSDDTGSTWGYLGGYSFKWLKQAVLDPNNTGMMYVTTYGNGLYYGPIDGVEGIARNVDNAPPKVSMTTPANNAINIAATTNLVMTFNDTVRAVAGKNITIKNLTDNSQITIDAADGQVVVSGSGALCTVTIKPNSNLLNGKNYAVQIDTGAFKDVVNKDYAGILDDTTWNFVTTPTPSNNAVISVDNVSGKIGTQVTVNVGITESSHMSAGVLNLVYDPAKLTPTSCVAGALLEGTSNASNIKYDSDKIRINWAGVNSIDSGGIICTITFDIKNDAAGGSTDLLMEDVLLADIDTNAIPYLLSSGVVDIIAIMPGDANDDRVIDVSDVLCVLKYDARLGTLSDWEFESADVNKDGKVDIRDALLILKYDAGLIDDFE